MIARNKMKPKIFFLALLFQPNALGSLGDEVKMLYSYFSDKTAENAKKEDVITLFSERETISGILRSRLLSEFGEKSHLFAFPDLDRQTFNKVIAIVASKYLSDEHAKVDALLHLWSYLTGIKIVGLKNGASYYEANGHIKKLSPAKRPPQELSLEFSTNDIFAKDVRGDDKELLPVDIPAEFRLRSAYYKSGMGSEDLIDRIEEPEITWEFLKNELEPLGSFAQKKDAQGMSPAKILLTQLFRLRSAEQEGLPLYSHGIVNLLRNVAIYVSQQENDDSQVIIGSFSIVSTSNLGLQDGIFLEKKDRLADSIAYLFGCQLFIRLFFRNFREYIWLEQKNDTGLRPARVLKNEVNPNKPKFKGPNCTEFDPHYEFQSVSRDIVNKFIEKGHDPFAKKFRSFIKAGGILIGGGNHGNFNMPYNLLPALIEELNGKQLQRRLVSARELLQTVKVVWFEPDSSVDASGKAMKRRFQSVIYDESTHGVSHDALAISGVDERVHDSIFTVPNLILHLTCYGYRNIEKLNLSGNALSDPGIKDLGKCFAKGVLPLLIILDLSNNRMNTFDVASFAALLQRDGFKYLDVSRDHADTGDLELPLKGDEQRTFHARISCGDRVLHVSCDTALCELLKKVIFLSQQYMHSLVEEEKYSTEVVELMRSHTEYYNGHFKLSSS